MQKRLVQIFDSRNARLRPVHISSRFRRLSHEHIKPVHANGNPVFTRFIDKARGKRIINHINHRKKVGKARYINGNRINTRIHTAWSCIYKYPRISVFGVCVFVFCIAPLDTVFHFKRMRFSSPLAKT